MLIPPTLVVHMPEELVVKVHEAPGYIVLRLSGQLSRQTAPLLREAAVKSLLGSGRVVIDVSQLRAPQASFVTIFPTALAAAGGWPSARLVLFGADTPLHAMLVSTRTTETVPLAADMVSALAILEQPPPEIRRHRSLPMHCTAASAARLFVRDACDAWLVPVAIREIAELVSSELVSNAVEHAHSTSELTLTRTRSALRVSVRDYCLGPLPRPRPIDVTAFRGRGLHLVAALAHLWGVSPHSDGKTVWANLPLDAQ
jgi:anti-sigma regulatory factor (Ser/Thr protein kinase)